MTKVAHIFTDADLRCSHLGLVSLMKKNKIKAKGNFVIFLNKKRTIVKMFCKSHECLLHYKNKDSRTIDPGVLKYLPTFCDGKKIDFDKASKAHLEDIFGRKFQG